MTLHAQATRSTGISFILTLIASTFLMGSSFVAAKALLTEGFTPMLLVGWRFLVAALATLPLLLLEQRNPIHALLPKGANLRNAFIVIILGLMQTTAVMGLLFLAMRSISASTAAILLFTNPIWVALLGRIFLKESLHGMRVIGLLLGIIGVYMAIGLGASSASPGFLIGELIGLASAFCWATATIINKRANLPFGSWALSFWQMFVGSIVLLAIAYGHGEHWPEQTTFSQWGWFIWLAIPASTGSFGLWFVALKKGGATKTSGYLFLAPVFTVLLSIFILNASMSWLQAAGGVLIGVALWMVNRETPTRTQIERSNEAIAQGEP